MFNSTIRNTIYLLIQSQKSSRSPEFLQNHLQAAIFRELPFQCIKYFARKFKHRLVVSKKKKVAVFFLLFLFLNTQIYFILLWQSGMYSQCCYQNMDWKTGKLQSDSLHRQEIFSLLNCPSRLALGCTQPPIQRVLWALSPRISWSARVTDHSPPSAAEVTVSGAQIYPFLCFHTFTFILRFRHVVVAMAEKVAWTCFTSSL